MSTPFGTKIVETKTVETKIWRVKPQLRTALLAAAALTFMSNTGAHANDSGVPGIGAGGSGGASNGAAGGAGGRDDSNGAGGVGQASGFLPGGGGGGAGTVGGAGGSGEAGGSGGIGGAHALVSPTFGSMNLTGANGQAGGNGVSFEGGGGGGGGGAGGYGTVVSGSGNIGTLTTTLTGGNGGAGGAAGGPFATGGNGGSGGVGLFFAGNGATSATINGNVTGGNGGDGGAAAAEGGGGGGLPGLGGLPGNSGATGVGIVAGSNGNVTLTIGATVSGGSSPGLIRGDALRFTGGEHTVTFASGFGLIGAINVQQGSLTFNQPNSITLNPRLETIFQVNVNEIIGDGTVRFQGAGTVTLNAENAYTGGTQISGGNVALGNLSALGTGSVLFTNGQSSNLGFNVSGTFGQDIGVTTDSEGIISASTGQTVTLTGGLFVNGANSILTLGGPSSGNLIVGASGPAASFGASSTASIIIAGGQVTAGNDLLPLILANVQNVSVRSGAVLNLNDQTDPANFSGIGTLLGDGIIVTGTNAATIVPIGRGFFQGVISGPGGLRVQDVGAESNGTLILDGANTYTGTTTIDVNHTLQLGGQPTDSNAIPSSTGSLGSGAVINNGTLVVNRSNQVTLSGAISGTGALNQIGTGTTVLTGVNTYTGGTRVAGGTLRLQNNSAAGTGAITTTGSVIDYANGIVIANPVVVNSNTTQLQVLTGTATQAGVISELEGQRPLEKIGAGTLALTGANSYSGTTTISAGTLQVGNGGTTGTLGTGNVVNNSTLAFNRSDAIFVDNAISGTGALNQIGTDFVLLNGANSYTGTTTISGGTLQVGGGGTSGTLGTGNVVNNARLLFNRSDTITVDNAISGTGQLGKVGTGTLILTGANTYSGGTGISFGTLQVGNGGTTGSLGSGNVLNNATLAFNRSNALTVANSISGPGGLNQIGTGTTILTGANSYTGATTINAGTLQIGNGGTTGSLGTGAVTNNANLAFNRSDSVTYAGAITGTGALSQIGTGTTILTGANSYTGATTINAGTLQIGNGGSSGQLGTGALTNNGTLAVNRSDAVILAGMIAGTGALSQIGTGTTILTGANSYTGATTINAGTLQIGNGGTTGSLGTGAVTNNAILAFNRSDSVTYAGAITGTGALQKNGAGTLILTGASTFTGPTTINTGTLQIGNGGTSGQLGTGAVTNNAILAFNRSDSVTYAGAISGTGALSLIGTGTTILTGANSYTGATTINAGTLQIGNGGTSGQLGTGAVTNNANLAFNRSDSVTYAGAITGTGALQKNGAGTLILTGASTFTGPTSVNTGTLVVNGSLASAVNILAGARLGGIGSVGNLTVNGFLAPGSSPGTLTVNGNLVFGSGGVYIADVQAALADRVTVTGTATLAGTLQLNPLNGPYSFATPYTLLSAAGGLGGTTFGTVSTVGAFGSGIAPTISYTGTSVLLTLAQRNLVPLLPTGTLINARNVALGVDAAVAGGANPNALFAVYNLPASSLPAALNTLSGEVQTTRRATGVAVSDQFLRVLLDPNVAIEREAASDQHFAFWAAPFGLRNTTDGDGGVVGSADRRVTSTNFAFGLDVRVPGKSVIGAAISFGNANATLAQARGTASADIFEVGAHASSQLLSRLSLGAGFSYSQIRADTTRAIPTLRIAAIESSETSTVFGGRVEAAYQALNLGWADISLLAAGRVISVATPALLETAPAGESFAALAVRRQTDTSTRTEASIKIATPAAKALDGFLQLGWGHNFDQALDLNAQLTGLPGSDFAIFGARGAGNVGLARAGANYDLTKNFTLGARLEGQFSQPFREISWSVNLRYRF